MKTRLILSLLLAAAGAQAQSPSGPPPAGEHRGPPAEALTACKTAKAGSSRRAASAKPTASSGSSAPSIRRLPNSTLNGRFSRARESTALTRPASSRLASSSIHSPSAAALKARPSRACSSFRLKGWCMGTQRSASARR